MQLNHLRYFYVVASARGFSNAERHLKVRQPAISKIVKSLEQSLGVVLLERRSDGVALTPAGEQVFDACRRIFDEVDQIRGRVETARGTLRGDLAVACSEHVAAYLLPPVVGALRAEHPRLVPRLFTGPAHLLVREIVEGRHELGLFFKVERSPALDRLELARVPCQLVVAAGRHRDPSVLSSFIGSREIDDVSNKAFPTLAMLARARPDTAITVSCNSLEAHKALALDGRGVAILPLFMLERELAEKRLRVVHPEYVYTAALELVTRRGKVPSRGAQALLTLLRAELARRGFRAGPRSRSATSAR